MLESIQTYIQKIVLFGILTTISYQILPGEKYEKYIKLYMGFLFIFLIFFPLLQVSGIEASFRRFYQSYEKELNYKGEDEKIKETLYEKYEESLEKQLGKVLEEQGYQVDTIEVVTDRKEGGNLKEVSVTLIGKREDKIEVPVVKIQEKKELTKEEEQKKEEVKQLLSTMYQGEDISLIVNYIK